MLMAIRWSMVVVNFFVLNDENDDDNGNAQEMRRRSIKNRGETEPIWGVKEVN